MTDQERFEEACKATLGAQRVSNGIGTLSEKTLHAVLKQYYEPHRDNHEIKIGKYVADIVGENGIIEIQTAQFGSMRDKLNAFLEVCPVTVVHPVPVKRQLIWIDRETGELSRSRSAPCKDVRFDIFSEFSHIPDLLLCPNLSFCFPLLEIEEYRYLNHKNKNPKHHASRCDKIPTALVGEIQLRSKSDFYAYVPDCLPEPFTSADFSKAAKCAISTARVMLYVLHHIGITERVGKRGNGFLYRIVPAE